MSSPTIEDILGRKQPTTKIAWILLKPALKDELAELTASFTEAETYDRTHNEADTAPDIRTAIERLESTIADNRVKFVFQSIGRAAYSTLLDENKPRKGNADDKDVGFHRDEFPPRLLSLCCVEPTMSLAQAFAIWNGDEWSDADTTMLLGAAILANKEYVDVPFTKTGTSMATRTTGSRSNIVHPEEFDIPIS